MFQAAGAARAKALWLEAGGAESKGNTGVESVWARPRRVLTGVLLVDFFQMDFPALLYAGSSHIA